MPEINAITPVANQIKPQPAMTLADMLNIANAQQQYQQAQQLNPLALQKAQMEIEQAQQLNPIAVQKAKIEANKAQMEYDKSHLDVTGGAIAGLESRARVHAEKKDFATAKRELDATEKMLNAYGFPSRPDGPFAQAKASLDNKDMDGYLAQLQNMREIQAGASARYQANLPQVATVGNAPATFTQATGVANPLQIGGQAQAGSGNQGGGVPAENKGVSQTQMSLQYPVRRAGDIRPYAPSEAEDQKQGEAYRNNIVSGASNQTTSLRNLDEVIKQAEALKNSEWGEGAGIFGAAGRGLGTFLGTEQGVRYKQLSKDLANAQIANMRAMGLSTDADKTLVAAANGDYTYPPKVLEEIAHRNLADMKNIELQAQGAQIFSKKFGDNNLKTFQQLWGQNAKDSRVFEAISINESNLPKEEKIKRIDKLFEGLNSQQINKLTQQKNNLLKLSRTGEL